MSQSSFNRLTKELQPKTLSDIQEEFNKKGAVQLQSFNIIQYHYMSANLSRYLLILIKLVGRIGIKKIFSLLL